jgi:hypothetical protein
VAGDGGTILATENGGETWRPKVSGTTEDLRSVQFARDMQRGWVVGNHGTILVTRDGGDTWAQQVSGTTRGLWSLQVAPDGGRLWAVGDNGTILVSQNGGESWQLRPSGTAKYLISAYLAADGRRGWVVGQDGLILRLDPLDLTALKTATDLAGVRTALAAAGIPETAVGSPLEVMKVFEADRLALRDRIEHEESRLRALQATLPSLASFHANPVEIYLFTARFAFAVVLLFLVWMLSAAYRHTMRLAAHYDARADALSLAGAPVQSGFHQMVQSMTPLDTEQEAPTVGWLRRLVRRAGG